MRGTNLDLRRTNYNEPDFSKFPQSIICCEIGTPAYSKYVSAVRNYIKNPTNESKDLLFAFWPPMNPNSFEDNVIDILYPFWIERSIGKEAFIDLFLESGDFKKKIIKTQCYEFFNADGKIFKTFRNFLREQEKYANIGRRAAYKYNCLRSIEEKYSRSSEYFERECIPTVNWLINVDSRKMLVSPPLNMIKISEEKLNLLTNYAKYAKFMKILAETQISSEGLRLCY